MSTPPRASVLGAAETAIGDVRERLFPVRVGHWILLGLLTFLEQCGSGGGFPPSGVGNLGSGGGEPGISHDFSQGTEWLAAHVALVVVIALAVLTVIVVVMAVTNWLSSRGILMYVDAVATGEIDFGESFSRNGEAANSLFTWRFLTGLGSLVALLVALCGGVVCGVALSRAQGATVVLLGIALLLIILVFLSVALFVALFGLTLRDFVAPVQWSRKLSCGDALHLLLPSLKTHWVQLIGYVLLKFVVQLAAGVTILFLCCVCCLALLPIVSQTVLQPFFFFQRAFANRFLEEMGFPVMRPFPRPGPPPTPAPPGPGLAT